MSSELAKSVPGWTGEQKELIKRTVAKDATDDELMLFLHVAAKSGLDPLQKQIHFVKLQGRPTFIADINGLQARASRESDYRGIKHAVVYEKDDFVFDHVTQQVVKHVSNPFGGANGRIVGAWAIVTREGMQPFTSLVRFVEYSRDTQTWRAMPSVMIDKCAKSTALRLAYPEQLGGIYEGAELGKEEQEVIIHHQPSHESPMPLPLPPIVLSGTASLREVTKAKAVEILGFKEDPPKAMPPAQPIAQRAGLQVWIHLREQAKSRGITEEVAKAALKRLTGKSGTKTLHEDDIPLFMAWLDDEPPPHDDSHAPSDVPF